MGFLNRVGNFAKGGLDILTGTGEFILDVTASTTDFAQLKFDKGFTRIYDTFQEDLLGKAMQGAFGPEGMIGTVIGALPEEGPFGFIRTGGRSIIEPVFEGWDWTIQNVVDRPLGTFVTIVNAVNESKNIFHAFDATTWAAAWEINDKRTFGQSVAALAYNIDPFDDDEYDSIQDDAFFNLLSGTADFFQEFADPIGIALGGGANILRGKTVIGKIDDAGNFKGMGRTKYDDVGGFITPQKIYTPGGGVFRSGFKGERLSPEQLAARNLVGRRFATQRAQSTIKSRRYQRMEKQLQELELADAKTKGVGEGYSGIFEVGGSSTALINQRYGVLRQLVGRKGAKKLPEKAAYAIAKAATPEAREYTVRMLMGDMSVFKETAELAGTLNKLLESPDFLDDLAEYDRLSNLVRANEEGQRLGAKNSANRSMAITRDRLKMEELGVKLNEQMGDTAINSVDWNTIYDGYLGVLETRNRKVKDIDGNPTPDSMGQQNLFEGNEDLRAIAQRVVEDIVAISNRNADVFDKPSYTPQYKKEGSPGNYFKDYIGQELPYKMKKGYRSDGSDGFYSLREAIEDQAESGAFPENIEAWLEKTGLNPDEIEVLWVAENPESAVRYGAYLSPSPETIEVPDWSPEIYINKSTDINKVIKEIEDDFIDLEQYGGAVPILEDGEGGFLYARTTDGTPISQKTNLTDTGALKGTEIKVDPNLIPDQFGTINKWYSNPFEKYRKRNIIAMENRTAMTTSARLGQGVEYVAEEYAIPSVITPGGVRKFRISTERLPQALINFGDKHAFTQWERMLQQASRVRIGGESIIDVAEVNDLLGKWTEISMRPGESQAVFLKELFDDTVMDLSERADSLIELNHISIEESLVSSLGRTRDLKDKLAVSAQNKARNVDRAPRTAMSVSNYRTTTYQFVDGQGVTHVVNSALTPQQMRQSGVMPRWDRINTTLGRYSDRIENYAPRLEDVEPGAMTAADIGRYTPENAFKRRVQKTKDGFVILSSGADVAATKAMQVWRPAVLLTPKWPLRVQLDEFFRRAADLGVMTELRNLMHAYSDMKDVYATHGVDMNIAEVSNKIMERAKKLNGGKDFDHLGDALRHLESKNVPVEKVMKDHANDVIKAMGGSDKFLPKVLKKRGFQIPKVMYSRAGLTRLGVTGLLLGPVAAPIHAGIYGASRYRRISNVARREAGVATARALEIEGRRLLKEALAPDAPPGLKAQAELMLSRSQGMRKAIEDMTPENTNIDNIVDNMEKAHALLDEAGLANPTIYGATVRNAYGDNPDFREITTRSIATNKAVSGMIHGVRQAQEREILRFANADWETWDILDPRHSAKQVSDGWEYMMNYHQQKGNVIPEFYRIVWDADMTYQERISSLAAQLRKSDKLRKELGLDDLRNHPDPDYSRFEVPAQNIVDEFDDIIPQFTAERNFSELKTEFTKLRRAAAEGQPVVWTDVTNALKTAERNRVKRLNFEGSLREKKPGDLDFARERSINELIGYIRDNTGHMGFGRSISPNMKTVDFGRGLRAGHLGNMVQRLFKMFGEVPADQLSRNPYFRTKYNREVSRRLAYFMDDKGNVNISQNKLFEIEEDARNFAIGETRDLLYDLAEETRISEMLTHIAPFYNAWQEVLGRWAHLATQNPYFVAKAVELYTSEWDADFLGIEQITTYEEVEIGKKEQELGRKLTDEEKEDYKSGSYLVWRLPRMLENVPEILTPGPLGEIARNQDIRFSKEGLASMLNSTTPGFGPMITIPVREAVLRNPELEDAFGFMFPFGHPEGNRAIAGFLPAYQQQLINRSPFGVFGTTETKERVVQALAQQLYVEAEEAGRPIDLSDEQQVAQWIEEANARANSFFTFRVATGLFSPTSTTAISPYADLMQEFKYMRGKYGEKEANAMFLREYGEELFGLTARMTKLNDGVAASIEAEEGYQEYTDLIQTHPAIGAWVSGSVGATDEKFTFSQAAYRRQMNMDLSPQTPDVKRRERLSPLETMAQTEIRLGWMKYTDLNDRVRTYQAQREAHNLPFSLNSEAMDTIATLKRQAVERIKEEHPAWADEFVGGQRQERMVPVIDGFLEILNNVEKYPGLVSRPSMQHIMKYFELRGMVEQALVMRAESGKGSLNLEHSTNDDLLLWWETQKQALGQLPQFSEIFDRFFEYDLIPEQSFVSVLGA